MAPVAVVETIDEASGLIKGSDEILPPLVPLTPKVAKRGSETSTTGAPPRKKIRTTGEKTRRFVNIVTVWAYYARYFLTTARFGMKPMRRNIWPGAY